MKDVWLDCGGFHQFCATMSCGVFGICGVLMLVFMIFGIIEASDLEIFLSGVKTSYLLISIIPFVLVIIYMFTTCVWVPLGFCKITGLILNGLFIFVYIGIGIWVAVQYHGVDIDIYSKEYIDKRITVEQSRNCCFYSARKSSKGDDYRYVSVFSDCPYVTNSSIHLKNETCTPKGETKICHVVDTDKKSPFICDEQILGNPFAPIALYVSSFILAVKSVIEIILVFMIDCGDMDRWPETCCWNWGREFDHSNDNKNNDMEITRNDEPEVNMEDEQKKDDEN